MVEQGRSSNNGDLTEGTCKSESCHDTRFKTGNKFGTGRPVGSRNKAQLVLERIGEEKAEAILTKMIEKALEGDVSAMKFLLERVWPARKGTRIPLPLPVIKTLQDIDQASTSILEVMAKGEISPEEAEAINHVLDYKRRDFETRDLVEQLNRVNEILAKQGIFPKKT